MSDTIQSSSGTSAASSTQQLVIQFAPRVCEVPLTQGHVALVDEADFDRVMQFKWHHNVDNRNVYARTIFYPLGRRGPRIRVQMHRFILSAPEHLLVDHIDHNGLNNTRANLRLVTVAQNSQGRRMNHNKRTCTYRGVSLCGGRWIARIEANGHSLHVGVFPTAKDAALAWNAKAIEMHGEFALLNVIPEVAA